MTPRHLAMFCLGQLAAIAAGILFARLCRRVYLQFRDLEKFPAEANWFASYGWMLVVIPIACVLLLPRRREDAETPQMGFVQALALLVGGLVMVFGFWVVMVSVFRLFGAQP